MEVYKTNVTCSLGVSVQDPVSGSWEKANVQVSSEVGPGYPDASMMRSVMTQQMNDAVDGCQRWIDEVARQIVAKVQGGAV